MLDAVPRVPYGTITYGGLAKGIGSPSSSRAVGTVLGSNPVCILVPCHRVVRRDRGLGGYAGGQAAKRSLLELEGASRGVERASRPAPAPRRVTFAAGGERRLGLSRSVSDCEESYSQVIMGE